MSRNTPYSFHRLPLSDGEMLKLWLVVLRNQLGLGQVQDEWGEEVAECPP